MAQCGEQRCGEQRCGEQRRRNTGGLSSLCDVAMGQPELGEDPKYIDHIARGKNQLELDGIINEWTTKHTMDEVDSLMIEHSIPAGRVYTAKDMVDDPHFKAREAIIEVETEGHGKLKMQNAFPRFSKSKSGFRTSAPTSPGQHNEEVLVGVVGLGEADIEALREGGVI